MGLYTAACDRFWRITGNAGGLAGGLAGGRRGPPQAQDSYGYRPLHYAAWFGTVETIRLLLEAGAEVMALDAYGETALHYAARFASAENVTKLLLAGADAQAVNSYGETPETCIAHNPTRPKMSMDVPV
jgi:ankyrin repeat protein